MQVGSIASTYPFRTTTAAGTAPGGVSSDPQSLRDRALDLLKTTAEADADSIKARAKQRLEDAKTRLDYLRRWNFDPEVLARQAGHLARELGAAAKDFAAAVNAGSNTGAAASGPEAQTTLAGQTDAQIADTAGSGEDETSFAQKAYQDMMADGTDQKTVSADDRRTLEEFKAVAQEIKALLEEALRRLRAQKNADQNAITDAQTSGESLTQAIQGVKSALGSGSPAGVTAAIPISITI